MKKKYLTSSIPIANSGLISSQLYRSTSLLSQKVNQAKSNSISVSLTSAYQTMRQSHCESRLQSICKRQKVQRVRDDLTEVTVKRNKKIVLKRITGIRENSKKLIGKQIKHDVEKQDDSFLDNTFLTSSVQSLKNSCQYFKQEPSLPLITINNDHLYHQFSKKRSSVYHLISELDSKFKNITNIEFKKKSILEQLSEGMNKQSRKQIGKQETANECLSVRMVYQMEKGNVGEEFEISDFKL